jgi:PAS domain S-box-containing protein
MIQWTKAWTRVRTNGHEAERYIEPLLHLDTDSLLRTFVESLPEGVLIIDREGRVLYMNEAGAKMLDLDAPSCIGQSVEDIVDFRPVVLQALETGRGYLEKEFRIESPTRGPLHFIKSAILLRDDAGQVLGVIDCFRKAKVGAGKGCRDTEPQAQYCFSDIIGHDPQFLNAIRLAQLAASTDATVLLDGESGTGKELFAHAIHTEGEHRDGPFVVVNCAGLPQSLIESELFGHVSGAFTGATREGYAGKFEQAHNGTIFLDEISELPIEMQAKLLRVLQDKTFTRLGGSRPITTNARIIAATNRDLLEEVRNQRFRADLFYRLNVLRITIPPLRSRESDVFYLAEHIIEKLAARHGVPSPKINWEVHQALARYDWPGNIRELENMMERAIILANGGGEIRLEHVPDNLTPSQDARIVPAEGVSGAEENLDTIERSAIMAALRANHGNVSRTAHRLGVSRNTLYRKIEKYKLR